jgi:hypothetical protein
MNPRHFFFLVGLCALHTHVPAWAADTRADFLKLPDRPRVPLAAEISA